MLTAAAVSLLFIFFIRAVKSALIMPVKTFKGIDMFAVVRVKGSVPQLEQTIKSLSYIREDGKMPIIILDDGMDEDTRKIAHLASKSKDEITVRDGMSLESMMTCEHEQQ